MAREIPEVVRAAAGLAATVLDEARKLPETLPGLPVRVIGLAMQQAMKVQQQYAGLVARGDELFTGLRGEDEPGLATFDEDLPPEEAATAQRAGYRESAFDRADVPLPEMTITEDTSSVSAEQPPAPPTSPAPPTAGRAAKPRNTRPKTATPKAARPRKGTPRAARDTEAVPSARTDAPAAEQVAGQIEDAQQRLDALPAEAPTTDEVLEELAIDDLVDAAPSPAPDDSPVPDNPLLSADAGEPTGTTDVATPVDVLTAGGEVETVDAAVTDEGVAAPVEAAPEPAEPATAEPATAEPAAPEQVPAASADTGSSAPRSEPVTGYDGMSIAQLRGRLRGYAPATVEELLGYEQATRAREPYVRMLRNRSERLRAEG
jgi:hypothetical protein